LPHAGLEKGRNLLLGWRSSAATAPKTRRNPLRRVIPLVLAVVCLVAAGAARAEDPLDDPVRLLERLFAPPVRAVEKALRPPRPAHVARPAPAAPAPPTVSADTAAKDNTPASADLLSVPMPHLRPGDTYDATLGYAPANGIEAAPLVPGPQAQPEPPAQPESTAPTPPLKAPPPAAGSTCGVAIAKLGVKATPLAPVQEGECGIPAPVSIDGLDGGAVVFSTKALLDCDLAEVLATWMDETVQPIAMRTLSAKVTGLRIAASYACRNRDSLADAKLSEHARGNAIDISAFRVAGIGWIDVETGWTGGGDKATFLQQVRASACGPFTTVLGPGADSYHATHFHLDRAKRRTAGPSRGLFCQ
jgi:hypothetical protein